MNFNVGERRNHILISVLSLGHNFMHVSLEVLEGKRPPLPSECPQDFSKKMKKCWHALPTKRPTMDELVSFFETQLVAAGDHGSNV